MRLTLKTPSKNHQLLKYIIHANAAVDGRVVVLYRWRSIGTRGGGLCCDLTKARVKVMKNSVNGRRKC